MDESKRLLRVAAQSQRNALPTATVLSWSRQIQARLLVTNLYRRASALALYSPADNEVRTENLRDHALAAGKKVFYPRSNLHGSPSLIRVDTASELIPGRWGILEPCGQVSLSEEEGSDLLVIVPGVAFDIGGNRLGRGRGWYDRLLAHMQQPCKSVGLAYEIQIVGKVPVETWDQSVCYLVTEKRLIECLGEPPARETVLR